jgi:hypothetical protein
MLWSVVSHVRSFSVNNLDRFVQDRDITTFIELLHAENDSTKRHTLKKLLIEEENKFGSHSDKLDRVERGIEDSQKRITAQDKIIDRLRANGSDCSAAERVLANFGDLSDLFRGRRQTLLDHLRRTGL